MSGLVSIPRLCCSAKPTHWPPPSPTLRGIINRNSFYSVSHNPSRPYSGRVEVPIPIHGFRTQIRSISSHAEGQLSPSLRRSPSRKAIFPTSHTSSNLRSGKTGGWISVYGFKTQIRAVASRAEGAAATSKKTSPRTSLAPSFSLPVLNYPFDVLLE